MIHTNKKCGGVNDFYSENVCWGWNIWELLPEEPRRQPWPAGLSSQLVGASSLMEMLPLWFPVRACTCVAGSIPSQGLRGRQPAAVFLSLCPHSLKWKENKLLQKSHRDQSLCPLLAVQSFLLRQIISPSSSTLIYKMSILRIIIRGIC